MSAPQQLRARLRLLIESGALPSSACGQSFLRFIEPLLAAQVITRERSGGGRKLVVQDGPALERWFHDRFPLAEPPSGSARVSALAQFRDTKALRGDTGCTVLVRCWSESALSRHGQPVRADTATQTHGVFSFVLDPATDYHVAASCAAIENPALLFSFETLGLTQDLPLALYAGGRMSSRVLAWLASQDASDFRLVHFPDYDPVGLTEFLRVRSVLGARAALYVPNNLAAGFARLGNPDLLRKKMSQKLLQNLRASAEPEVARVVELIDRHNAGLEQEALLLLKEDQNSGHKMEEAQTSAPE